MQTRPVLWIAPLAFAAAIGCTPKQTGLPNAPIFNTGARATIIMPGQSAPPMPGQNNVGPTGTAQMGTPYGGQHLGGPGAPPPGTPPSQYGNPNDLSMLGGAVTVDTFNIKKPRNALNNNPLLWPLAFVAWPFEKIASAVEGGNEQERLDERAQRIIESGGAPGYMTANRQQQAQMQYEQAQNDSMEAELAQRNGGAAMGSQVASAAPSGGGSSSIAAELEALRQRSAATPRRGAAPSTAAPGAAGPADEAEDRDGDGQTDRWVYDGERKREVFDDDGDGRPDRTVLYEPGGKQMSRVEQDSDGDGSPDTWVLYEGGKMTQRRADSNHDGQPDTWTFYDASGQVARQASDLDGDGQRDRAEMYENGKLARRTEDLDGDGRPDRDTRYDAKGQPIQTEEDKDGDGQIDVRSFYESGKLVKRQILDEEAQEATP